jgi:prepilin-type N-terminal cleavage/methylation domain-containing protein
MRRFIKRLHRGEKGFTLIELLIVVAILGILAAVVVPNVGGFFSTGKLNAANTEVANVETAAMGYYADEGAWPTDSSVLYNADPALSYLSDEPSIVYPFDDYGKVELADGAAWSDPTIVWSLADHKFVKGAS